MNTHNWYVVLGSGTEIILQSLMLKQQTHMMGNHFNKLSSKIIALGSGSKWQCMKVLNSSPTDTYQRFPLHTDQQKPLKTSEATPSYWATENKTTSRWIERAETQFCYKLTPPPIASTQHIDP